MEIRKYFKNQKIIFVIQKIIIIPLMCYAECLCLGEGGGGRGTCQSGGTLRSDYSLPPTPQGIGHGTPQVGGGVRGCYFPLTSIPKRRLWFEGVACFLTPKKRPKYYENFRDFISTMQNGRDTTLFLILYRRQVVEGVTECTLD